MPPQPRLDPDTQLVLNANNEPLVEIVTHRMRDADGLFIKIVGLASRERLKKGQLIGYYFGNILDQDDETGTYQLVITKKPRWWPIDKPFGKSELVDGRRSPLRFMNAPYVGAQPNIIFDKDGGCYATCDIEANTVLLVDYGKLYWDSATVADIRYRLPKMIADLWPRQRNTYESSLVPDIKILQRPLSGANALKVERLNSQEVVSQIQELNRIARQITKHRPKLNLLLHAYSRVLDVLSLQTLHHLLFAINEQTGSSSYEIMRRIMLRYRLGLQIQARFGNMFRPKRDIWILNEAMRRISLVSMTANRTLALECCCLIFARLVSAYTDDIIVNFADGLVLCVITVLRDLDRDDYIYQERTLRALVKITKKMAMGADGRLKLVMDRLVKETPLVTAMRYMMTTDAEENGVQYFEDDKMREMQGYFAQKGILFEISPPASPSLSRITGGMSSTHVSTNSTGMLSTHVSTNSTNSQSTVNSYRKRDREYNAEMESIHRTTQGHLDRLDRKRSESIHRKIQGHLDRLKDLKHRF